MLNYKNLLFIREEKNGMIVYSKKDNLYKFYEGIYIHDLENVDDVFEILEKNKSKINRNIDFHYPIRLNWLIEEKCMLDCIYCFAHDKMNNNETYDEIVNTVENIKNLKVINVGISGGEPTLNKHLKDVIERLDGYCSINLDTNGISTSLGEMAPLLYRANVLVRITIDAVSNDLLNRIRPLKNNIPFDYVAAIIHNIKKLQENHVPIMIHTVVTQLNKDHLEKIGDKLVELGIYRWHLYGVNYSERCKEFYDSIKVDSHELKNIEKWLIGSFGKKINISFYFDEGNYSSKSVLMINSRGEFFLDSIFEGNKLIGKDPKNPTLDEINSLLDIDLHCFGYLWMEENNDR